MKLDMQVKINTDLTVPLQVLQFSLIALSALQRAYAQAQADAQPPDGRCNQLYPEYRKVQPTQFKISLIKMIRCLPGQEFDLRDAKNIMEFVLENRDEIERIVGV